MHTTQQTNFRRALMFGFVVSAAMLLGTIGMLVAYGPNAARVANLLVAVCNLIVFASLRRHDRSRAD